jgi:hypothetical protein
VQLLVPVIPATQEAEIRRITVQGQPGEKGQKDVISISKPSMEAHACDPSYAKGLSRRIMI